MVSLSLLEAHRVAMACLTGAGCDDINARCVADTVVAAQADGCPAHGLFRLPGYCAALHHGRANATASPRVECSLGNVIRIDGDAGFAPRALQSGYEPLIVKAHRYGLAALAIGNTFHFAALWHEVETLARSGLVALAFTGSRAYVAPAGGVRAVYGTNPMAFAWPRDGANPLVFDQASSALSRGDIMLAARDGHSVADNVGIDALGRATNDPNAILQGAQLAFGGHKGAALALMVELLSGPLLGEQLGVDALAATACDEGPARGGELVLALDPDHFSSTRSAKTRAEALFRVIEREPTIRLPSARRYRNRIYSQRHGVAIPQPLYQRLRALAES